MLHHLEPSQPPLCLMQKLGLRKTNSPSGRRSISGGRGGAVSPCQSPLAADVPASVLSRETVITSSVQIYEPVVCGRRKGLLTALFLLHPHRQVCWCKPGRSPRRLWSPRSRHLPGGWLEPPLPWSPQPPPLPQHPLH